MIPPAFIQELLARADIVELIGRTVPLKKAGINHKGLCPFHGEKTPSFSVSATRQTYHCFGCGAHGNAIGFLMEHAGLGFLDAVRELAGHCGLAVPEEQVSPEERARAAQARERRGSLEEVLAKAAAHYRAQLKASPKAIDYLKRRGLSGQIAARFGLGYAPDGWRPLASAFARYDDPLLEESGLVIASTDESGETTKRYDRFRDRVMFPIRSVQGEVIGFGGRVIDAGEPKYLNSPETPLFSKGRELYGLHEARQAIRSAGCVLVVEGYMDVVALAQLGFANAVATLGTACTAEHVQKLFRFTESVVFSFDGDAAGRRAAGRAMEAALPHASDTRSIRFLFLPPEHDPDSYVRELGAAAFQQRIEAAVPLSRQLLDAAAEGCDLATPEGRARLLSNARPLWQALPTSGVLRRQVLAELARAAQLPVDELAGLWQSGNAPRAEVAASPPWSGSRPRALRATAGARPRRPPPGPADHALRLLLLEGAWWDRLSPSQHELLHGLPAPHGELFAWLERQWAEHGPQPWSVMAEALRDTPWHEFTQGLVPPDSLDDEVAFEHLRSVLDRMEIERLKAEETVLIAAAASDPAALARYRDVHGRRRELERSAQAL